MPSQIVLESSRAIAGRNFTIAFAESATSGRLSYEYSQVPESGKILKGGLVCYDAYIKEAILGVAPQLVEQFTPESAEVTAAMAHHIQQYFKSDIAVAITGLTTSGGSESSSKPVGTMFIHILVKAEYATAREVFTGSPEEMVLLTIDRVAEMILEML